ncbi:MAG: hypothetical protein GXP45_04555 [bacterium]|nr:hypothetical protein [bacterium]
MKKLIIIIIVLYSFTASAQRAIEKHFPIIGDETQGNIGVSYLQDMGMEDGYKNMGIFALGAISNRMSISFNGEVQSILGDQNILSSVALDYKVQTENVKFGFGVGPMISFYERNKGLTLDDYSDPEFVHSKDLFMGVFAEAYLDSKYLLTAVRYSQDFDNSLKIGELEKSKLDMLLKPKYWVDDDIGFELPIYAKDLINFDSKNIVIGITMFYHKQYIFAQYQLNKDYRAEIGFRINRILGIGFTYQHFDVGFESYGLIGTYYLGKRRMDK